MILNLHGSHIFEYEGNMRVSWYDDLGLYMVINIDKDNYCTYEIMTDQAPSENITREEFFKELKEEFGV